jgi:hypothetical protein
VPGVATTTETHQTTTAAPLEIKLPRAQDWHKGMTICDNHGGVLFRVQEHYDDGTELMPNYHVYLSQPAGGEIVAVIEFHSGDLNGWWEIYTPIPRYPVQQPGIHLAGGGRHRHDKAGGILHELYLYAKVYPMYGCNRVTRVAGKDKEDCVYKYKTSGGKCCGRGSSRRVFYCADPWTREEILVRRDQINETLTLAPGQDVLLAVSMAYALDRHCKPQGSKEERHTRESPYLLGLRHGLVGFVRYG